MSVVNVKKSELKKLGYADFSEWIKAPNSLYIGRDMSVYVPGTHKSKWANPYSAKTYGLDACLTMYEKYVRESSLYDELEELDGKILGCWCKPSSCHGDLLWKLLAEKRSTGV